MARVWKWLVLLGVVAAPWLCGLSFPFLYDDIGMISENAFLEEPANLGRVLTGRTLADPHVVNGRRPAVLATYFLDRAWHGLRPAGWRATNLLLHLGCAVFLMLLVTRLTGHRFLAAATGLMFGLHPVLVEAVHAPGFRADMLCFLFILGFLHLHLGAPGRSASGRAGGLACLALALLSKETALAAPLVLGALMALFPAAFPAVRRTRLGALAACLMLAGVFFVLWVLLPTDLQAAGGSWNGESLRFPATVWSVPALWTRTLRLLLVPWPLNVTPAFEPVATPFSLRFAAGIFWLGICGWGAWRAHRAEPAVALGLAWMAVFFLPVSNLWPLLHPVADRYLYAIVPGFALLTGWLLAQQTRRGRACGLAALAAVYGLLVTLRLAQWGSAEKLWTSAYFQNPQSATAATWLGLLREEAGDAEGARALYAAAAAANPQAAPAWINWGIWPAGPEIWRSRSSCSGARWRCIPRGPRAGKTWRSAWRCRVGRRTRRTRRPAPRRSRPATAGRSPDGQTRRGLSRRPGIPETPWPAGGGAR
jgi:protein O-mannosyl-transferase